MATATNYNANLKGYQCVSCGKEHPLDPFSYTCQTCGNNLEAVYDYGLIGKGWSKEDLAQNGDSSLWRYLPLLPVGRAPEDHSIMVGGTPLVSSPAIASQTGLKHVYIKDDTRNPSSSLKDRATEIGIRHALELGQRTIIAASTGNAAASLATLSAFYKVRSIILAPASAPPAKLTQILQHGATLCPVDGTYDDAFDLASVVAKQYGWYSRNTGTNPVLSEGKKTVALEIAEQLNWSIPDQVFVPVGDGCILAGVYKGFYDLVQLGWIDAIPKLVAVQAEGSKAVVAALDSGGPIVPGPATTIADSISVSIPRDGLKAIHAVHNSAGYGLTVSDDEILQAQKQLATNSGIFAEPAAAAAYAGFLKAVAENRINRGDTAIVLATGSGLKDIPAAQKQIQIPPAIKPDADAFGAFMKNSANAKGQPS